MLYSYPGSQKIASSLVIVEKKHGDYQFLSRGTRIAHRKRKGYTKFQRASDLARKGAPTISRHTSCTKQIHQPVTSSRVNLVPRLASDVALYPHILRIKSMPMLKD